MSPKSRRAKKPKPKPKPKEAEGPPTRSRRRKWLARLLLVVLAPTVFLGLLELGLRVFGYGYPTAFFVAAERGEDYVTNPKVGWRFFGAGLSRTPTPTVLAARKPAGTYRIFVFGGSAAFGTPNAGFSFSRILEAMLNDRLGPTRFEVINTAMVAVNSHVLLPIVRECAGRDGDLYIVYVGNNEVVGPYGAGTVIGRHSPSRTAIRAGLWLRSTRVGQLMGDLIRSIGSGGDREPKAWGGMQMFVDNLVPADDPRLASVYENYRANLADMRRAVRDAGRKILLVTVVTNLKDLPPFAAAHRPDLTAEQRARWDDLYRRGGELSRAGEHHRAIAPLRAAAEIDDRHAGVHFRLGKCYLALGKFEPARTVRNSHCMSTGSRLPLISRRPFSPPRTVMV